MTGLVTTDLCSRLAAAPDLQRTAAVLVHVGSPGTELEFAL